MLFLRVAAHIIIILFFFLALLAATDAFLAPTKQVTATLKNKTELHGLPYGEDSRQYRRTVFDHDAWKKHRSPDRFTRNLASIFKSGVYKNIGREVFATTSIAIFVFVYNIVSDGYTDFACVEHEALIQGGSILKLGLPLSTFTLASGSLGLLLGKPAIAQLLLCRWYIHCFLTVIVN